MRNSVIFVNFIFNIRIQNIFIVTLYNFAGWDIKVLIFFSFTWALDYDYRTIWVIVKYIFKNIWLLLEGEKYRVSIFPKKGNMMDVERKDKSFSFNYLESVFLFQ